MPALKSAGQGSGERTTSRTDKGRMHANMGCRGPWVRCDPDGVRARGIADGIADGFGNLTAWTSVLMSTMSTHMQMSLPTCVESAIWPGGGAIFSEKMSFSPKN